jgi:hypothetical protein
MPTPTAGPSSLYPSNIVVSGLGGTVSSVQVFVNNINHTWPDDIDMLLVGPGGQTVMLMSDAGGSSDLINVNLTFSDAGGPLPDSLQITSGVYHPTDYEPGDNMPAPAPTPPYGTALSVFNGTNPNGTWSLYVADDADLDGGSIDGGWCLVINGALFQPATKPHTFNDVPAGSTFYPYVNCLVTQSIVSGYPDGTFRPNANVTRGQAAKLVVYSAGYSDKIPATRQTFSDVPGTNPFWEPIELAAAHGILTGYPDGTFHPNQLVSRGQLAKIAANAAGYSEPVTTQTFSDVPADQPFYLYIERMAARHLINGYPDGTFRPGNGVTRGQAAKIVSNALLPTCPTTPIDKP